MLFTQYLPVLSHMVTIIFHTPSKLSGENDAIPACDASDATKYPTPYSGSSKCTPREKYSPEGRSTINHCARPNQSRSSNLIATTNRSRSPHKPIFTFTRSRYQRLERHQFLSHYARALSSPRIRSPFPVTYRIEPYASKPSFKVLLN